MAPLLSTWRSPKPPGKPARTRKPYRRIARPSTRQRQWSWLVSERPPGSCRGRQSTLLAPSARRVDMVLPISDKPLQPHFFQDGRSFGVPVHLQKRPLEPGRVVFREATRDRAKNRRRQRLRARDDLEVPGEWKSSERGCLFAIEQDGEVLTPAHASKSREDPRSEGDPRRCR